MPKKSHDVIHNNREVKAPVAFWHFRKRRERTRETPGEGVERIPSLMDAGILRGASKSLHRVAGLREDDVLVQSNISTRPRAVRFARETTVHFFEPADKKHSNLLWYTGQEILAMDEYNKKLVAAKLSSQSSDPDSWSKRVLQVYRAFRRNCSTSELSAILSTCNIYFDEHTIGMVDAAIPIIARDFQVRRRYLMAHVVQYQGNPSLSAHARAKLISDASHATSHVSRSFAVFTAHLIDGEE